MKAEYIKDKKVYSFPKKLSEDEYTKFYNGELEGFYEREYVEYDLIPEKKKYLKDLILTVKHFQCLYCLTR